MTFERWGSLSVADHLDIEGLIGNVLLYDRLVVPVATAQPDRDEEAYWETQGWRPQLQKTRLDQLGPLAIQRPWDAARRQAYRSYVAELGAGSTTPSHVDAFGITRRLLAREHVVDKPEGVHHVQVIAAYNSTEAALRDFRVDQVQEQLGAQAFLLTRRLAVPDLPDPEEALVAAIELARDPQFREKRAELFEWQELVVRRGIAPKDVVAELAAMADAYNEKVRAAVGKVRTRLAFTLFGIGMGFATGGVAGAAVGAALSLVQFAMLDGTPAVEAGSTRPAAMFQDVAEKIGARLRK